MSERRYGGKLGKYRTISEGVVDRLKLNRVRFEKVWQYRGEKGKGTWQTEPRSRKGYQKGTRIRRVKISGKRGVQDDS